jgi:hypothetical protein
MIPVEKTVAGIVWNESYPIAGIDVIFHTGDWLITHTPSKEISEKDDE